MEIVAHSAPGFRRNPTYSITVKRFTGTVVVFFADAVIASTTHAKVLREQGHEPVYYIPFEDIYFEFLRPSETRTYCPFKGHASYWNVIASGDAARDVMWSYQDPYSEMAVIDKHAAFYPRKVRIDVTPASRM
ncbi:uncharacterized protein (DUF427 family) [Pseudaminobacter salicylatoxidans]|uniref:Uncharacterized protein (DUF427 family) n=1 Tax=Pseudaminobacter salicylatoxidans TaxID=93369 RepID=A0A316C7B1_PSESE|nr:DUF427 domain-containing protein [Pseudaminobacter salicylatoxidans]PWJ85398.1 uncharacterized protein (DUF427 family) [Pseudaminobacter salicylatoxidans]